MDISKVYYHSENGGVTSSSYLCSRKADDGYVEFNIAAGYIDETDIIFENEHIRARVSAAGLVTFYDADENEVACAKQSTLDEGDGRYRDISCKVENGRIMIRFPNYSWIDHYPNCDGESDRWDSYVAGYKAPIVFNMADGVVE